MVYLTHTAEAIPAAELTKLREHSIENFANVSARYHYGSSESNATYPEGQLYRIGLKAHRGQHGGIGVVTNALDETTLMTEKRLRVQQGLVAELIEALDDAGHKGYEVEKVIVLFAPIKIFVLLSNGIVDENIIYMSLNGLSNGSGQRKEINWPEGVRTTPKRVLIESNQKWIAQEEKKISRAQKELSKAFKDGDQLITDYQLKSLEGTIERCRKSIEDYRRNIERFSN